MATNESSSISDAISGHKRPLREGSSFVCYHWPCPDGIFSALAAYLALQKFAEPEGSVSFLPLAIYRPVEERVALAEALFTPESTVYIVDFSGGLPFLQACCKHAKSVILLDHHKTAQQDLEKLQEGGSLPENLILTFDMERSGAGIARDYFKLPSLLAEKAVGSAAEGKEEAAARILELFSYVQDHDLWHLQLPNSKAFSAGLQSLKLPMDVGGKGSATAASTTTSSSGREEDSSKSAEAIFEPLLLLSPAELVAKGLTVMAEEDKAIAAEVAAATDIVLVAKGQGQEGAAAAAASAAGSTSSYGPALHCLGVISAYPDLRSRLGNALAEASRARGLAACAVVAYVEPGMADSDRLYKVSLRSIGDCDTTVISKSWGGGGHANASSFNLDRALLHSWFEEGRKQQEKVVVDSVVEGERQAEGGEAAASAAPAAASTAASEGSGAAQAVSAAETKSS